VYEGSTEADDQYVKDHEQGVIDPKILETATKLAERFKEMYLDPLVQAAIAANSVPTTPENSTESVTDTFGCYSCSNPSKKVAHSRACKARRSRFDKINKELNNGNQG
jgi:hypothetical protein